MAKFNEYQQANLTELANHTLEFWKTNSIFEKSVEQRPENNPFVFFEGPPSANGMPGIHHVMARAIKDIFCRYKTAKGFRVERKAGWDTHGLPVELGVEKELGITKEDIGNPNSPKSISVEEYNNACREAVMRYTDVWNDLTEKMGYWVDMQNPYITYKTKYIETVWWLLKQLSNKNMLYKGYTIQPYSPKAGTGLSSHELNQPGCYRDVKDTTVVAQFKVKQTELANQLFGDLQVHFLAWTTTPWTLPSNTALAVGPKISYLLVQSFNQYTYEPIYVVVAENLLSKHFNPSLAELALEDYKPGDKKIPFKVLKSFTGSELVGVQYEQLLPWALPAETPEQAFRVIPGDFVTTEDGTGIVHIAPTFGADDAKVAKDAEVPPMLVEDESGNLVPLVNLQGKFIDAVGEFGGKYVKNEYYTESETPEKSADVEIAILLKEQNKAFKVEKYEHSYPHCWRTDKPILYYPLDSWFIRATEAKETMVNLNKTINWKPASTGTGRFGNWLENVNDWNLSRSRYWGIPLPIWRTEEGDEQLVIGSVEELKTEIEKAVTAGVMAENPLANFTPNDFSDDNYNAIDLHRNVVDKITLVSPSGKPMHRESDLIDVWFDSGAMPYAQWHYPFENKEKVDNQLGYPADFIAEGVDQTRGWFYTLHAISSMVFGKVAYKNVISNGLVLDKNGQKMSKRLGNAIDPFSTLEKFGPDATRWYMITNAQPWDNLKFDLEGITEVQRKFFRALQNTYSFFALYANIDGFVFREDPIPLASRPEIDQWIISKLNSLIQQVDKAYAEFEPTKAGRLIQDFVVDDLSNWHVRLSRKRFWRGEYTTDKIAAYQTLYTCLDTVAKLAAPIAPFYTDVLYRDLNNATHKQTAESVHLADFPVANTTDINQDLEQRMNLAQRVSSMVLSLRKRENIRVRQPLQKIMVPVSNADFERQLNAVADLIKAEVNIKEIEYLSETSGILVKSAKPNFKLLGKKLGKNMKAVSQFFAQITQAQIAELEAQGEISIPLEQESITILLNEVEISSQDIPGWLVTNEGNLTVALDITITPNLYNEGLARELVNRIQNIRKDSGFEVTDKILISVENHTAVQNAVSSNFEYICAEVLATDIKMLDAIDSSNATQVELDDQTTIKLTITKV